MSSHWTDAVDLGAECCRGKLSLVTSYKGIYNVNRSIIDDVDLHCLGRVMSAKFLH